MIRKHAEIDDWIVGTGAKTRYGYDGRLIYAMQVSEALTFDEYWEDSRFLQKRPNLAGSLQVVYGDNIYHHINGEWVQCDSHHSFDEGKENDDNLARDTSVNRVLVSERFAYWGRSAPVIPPEFRAFGDQERDICGGRGHQVFACELPSAFESWLDRMDRWGVLGEPLEFANHEPELGASVQAKNSALGDVSDQS